MTPDYQLLIDGKDVSSKIKPRLIGLTLTDNRGFEADSLEVQLDDTDGSLALPRKGAKMQVLIGYKGLALVDKGLYTIDEVEHSGAPDTMTIRGKSADMRGSLLKSREESFHKTKLGQVIETIASRHKLTPKITELFEKEVIEHIDQANESDAQFMTRLAERFDAIATVKNEHLMFVQAGQSVGVTGQPLSTIHITRQSGDSHSFSVADRQAYAGVKAYWQNEKAGKREEVLVKKQQSKAGEDDDLIAGSDDNIKTLRHIYASKKTATRAAKAMWEKIQRGVATFSLTLAKGQPELIPETPVTVSGFKPQINNSDWILVRVVHNLNDSGYTSALELEVKNKELAEVE